MAERTLPIPPSFVPNFVRWFFTPAFLGLPVALFTAAAATIRRHTRQPALPRMSEEWLRTHNADSGHQGEFWRDRW